MTNIFRKICFVLLIAFCGLVSPFASATTFTEEDAESVRSEIAEMMAAYERGEFEVLLAKSHPALYRLAGGREALADVMREALEKIKEANITFVSTEIGTPTALYPAGSEEVCFVPMISLLTVGDRHVRSVGFMLAIRAIGGNEWKYLDGAGLRDNPELLHTLLPALRSDVPLPPNRIEVL